MKRKAVCLRWEMMGGNETWIWSRTKINIDKIYKFLEEKTLEAEEKGKRQPSYTYNQIAKELGMDNYSVRFAVQKLAYKRDPYVIIKTSTYRSKKGVKCGERVKIIKFAAKKKSD